MVKNTTGGSKHKNIARKAINSGRGRLRYAEEEGEIYAIVTKILGGSMCSVMGSDNTERMCVIRGKFRGGKRRDNMLRSGTLVLAGDRGWETSSKKITCDLLEVYSDNDKNTLKNTVTTIDWKFLNGVGEITSSSNSDITDGFDFTNDTVNEEYQTLIEAETLNEAKTGKPQPVIDFDHKDEIDIDDI